MGSPVKRVQCQGRDNKTPTTAIITAILLIIIIIMITIMVRTANVTMVVIVQGPLGKSQCHACPYSRASTTPAVNAPCPEKVEQRFREAG